MKHLENNSPERRVCFSTGDRLAIVFAKHCARKVEAGAATVNLDAERLWEQRGFT